VFGVWRGNAAASTCTRPPGNRITSPPGERRYSRSENPTALIAPASSASAARPGAGGAPTLISAAGAGDGPGASGLASSFGSGFGSAFAGSFFEGSGFGSGAVFSSGS